MKLVDFVTTRPGRPMPGSLYAEEARSTEREREPLRAEVTCEVAIVGAGFTGLSTALHLAQMGVDCVVLEANEPGWGASGRNGGQINPGLKHGPDEVAARFGPWAVRFSQDAPDRVFELVESHQIACDIRRGGTLRAATDDIHMAQLRDLAGQMGRHGLPCELLSAEDMAHATGTPSYAGGLFDPKGGQINPLKYARGLAAAVRAQGVAIWSNSPVVKADEQGGHWTLTAGEGRVRARKVLFATNGYTDGLVPRLRRSVIPVFSSILASAPLPEEMAARLLAGGQSLFEVGPVTTYYRVDASLRLIFGGRGRMGDANGPGAFPSLASYAERLWPGIGQVGWEYGWNGRVALTQDHYPHVHRYGETGFACVGFNGRGVAMATAMGRELAAMLVAGDTHDPVFPTSPIKTIPFQPFWPAGVTPALAWARFKERIGGAT
ncbi:NAD(P)/FAD-dependent oxidoreductase [Pseudooceanicola pacificus]|nr:FAD-binding oxidoreductase [Pseudooceanicola pacificus]